MLADKENQHFAFANKRSNLQKPANLFTKKGDLDKKEVIAGRFGKLLTSATNEIREESDTLYAIDQQAEEAVTVLSEWLQESQDFQLAQDLAKALEEERDCQRRLELIQGEAEALRVAVDEKRRIKSDAQSKADRERADEEFAKKLAADEVKYFESKKQQFEDDEKFCYELEAEEKRYFAQSKDEVDADEKYARELQGDFPDEKDCKSEFAKTLPAFSTLNEQLFAEHKEDEPEHDGDYVVPNDEEEKANDEELSTEELRIKKRSARANLLQEKLKSSPNSSQYMKHNFHIMKDEAVISKLWEKANAEIMEITDALVLTIQLPNIQKLHIGIENYGRMIKIDAKRFVRSNISSTKMSNAFTTDSTQYIAEFVLDGEIFLTNDKIYHEYNYEHGLVHIYIEDICLDMENLDSANTSVSQKGVGALSTKGKNILNAFKNNFLRIFQ